MKPITQFEEWRWQRIAIAALDEITAKHKTLPVIIWQLTGGMKLVGVVERTTHDDAMAVYGAWRDALARSDASVVDGEKHMRDDVKDWRWTQGTWTTKRGGHRVTVALSVYAPLAVNEEQVS